MQQLSEDQIGHYEREGYIVLREVFGPIEVEDRLNAVRRVVRPMNPPAQGAPNRRGVGFDDWTGGPGDDLNPHRVSYINDLYEYDDRLDAHMRDPRLVGAICDLIGPDINAYQSATVIKTPRASFEHIGWHQDIWDYQPLSNRRHVNTITYLYHMGPDAGSTSLVPRSHVPEVGVLERAWIDVDGLPRKKRILKGFERFENAVITPRFEPGDILMFSSWLIHRACSNDTDESKVGLINVYQSADCIDLENRNDSHVANLPIARDGQALGGAQSVALKASELREAEG